MEYTNEDSIKIINAINYSKHHHLHLKNYFPINFNEVIITN
jgi:hypothetical protein